MLEEFFRSRGYDVSGAGDGRSALSLAEADGVDVVVTDIVMPEMEGVEFIRELRGRHPGISVIALSGGGSLGPDTYLHIASKLGADRTFRKPVRLSELLKAVESLTGGGQPIT